MAHALQIDTLAFSEKLQAAGADGKLAKAIVEGITSADTSNLATKEDLKDVEAALRTEIGAVRSDMKDMETSLRTEIGEVRLEIVKTSNATVMKLGGIIGVLFVIDRIIPFFN